MDQSPILDLLMQASPDAQSAALQDALRKRAAVGALIQGIGGSTLGGIGSGMIDSADKGIEQADQRAQRAQAMQGQRLKMAMEARQQGRSDDLAQRRLALEEQRIALERSRMNQDAWGAIADPVTGGIVLYNKKTRETMPLGPGGGQPKPAPAAGGTLPGIPGKPTEGQRKKVLDSSESIAQLDMAIGALEKAPGAYGGVGNFVAGLAESAGGTPVQSLTARRYSPEELRVKNYVSNVVSKIINERAGANVTLREELRQKFLPQDTDGLDQAKQKLGDLRAMMGATYEAQGNGLVPESAAPPPASAPVRKFTRGKDGKLVEVK